MVGIILAMYGNKVTIHDAVFISLFAMLVVFVVLLIISYMIDVTAFFIRIRQKKSDNVDVSIQDTKKDEISDSALVATIAAAIASYMGTNVDDIVIKKIRRIK